jgi:alpha-L-rhamnosidase
MSVGRCRFVWLLVSVLSMGMVTRYMSTVAGAETLLRSGTGLVPYDLRCDDAVEPLGVDDLHPRLSWKLWPGKTRHGHGPWIDNSRSRRQTAYRILVASTSERLATDQGDLWDSGEIRSGRLPYAVYGGKPLRSGQRVYWKMRTSDENGVFSSWGAGKVSVGSWEMGLLRPDDWRGRWITADKAPPTTERQRYADDPAPLLRKEFAVTKPIASARIYISGLGYYELHLNGEKVGDHVLDPGWTDYARRALYVTYDVTPQLRRGGNALGIMLGNGWYNPLPLRMWGHLNLREHLTIGQPRVIAQLAITYADGTRQTVATDETWRWHDGPILRNSVYLGEVYDARREVPDWDKPVMQFANWRTVRVATDPLGPLCAQTAPPIRITRTLRPVKITAPTPGVAIVDLGQNFAGWVRLRVRGPAGTRITLRYGELLHPDGTLNPMTSVTGQIKGQRVEAGSEAPATAWQRDVYTLKGGGEEVYTPRFTFHGFRYVEITGFPGVPTAETITGLRLNADVEPVGTFACSNETFNRIQQMVPWTLQSNLFSVESDCPHREKFGYGGDIVAASEMAMLNFDMSRFYAKTVQDYADAARPNGGFTETAPYVGIADAGLGGETGPIEWGTAHPLLLQQLYRYYGNRVLIEQQYTRAQRWMALLNASAQNGILDNGIGDHEGLLRPPTALTGTAFYYANATLMAQLAEALGRKADAAGYRALAAKIKAAFRARFDPQRIGRFAEGGESSQAFALYYGLLPPSERQLAVGALVQDVLVTNQGHLDTGIFGTKYLLNALTDAGRADIAATIVGQKTFPGWGHMLENGATTLWEHWEYSDNTFSHNHPMFGSVSEWFYKAVAGIAPASDAIGFDRVRIQPHPMPGVTWARGIYRSIHGTIATEWAQRADGFHLTVTLPPNTSARVTVPASTLRQVTESGKPIDRANGVLILLIKDDHAILQVGSGTYHFVSRGVRIETSTNGL